MHMLSLSQLHPGHYAGSNYQFKDSLHAQLETYCRVLLAAAQPEDALAVEAMKTKSTMAQS